MNKSIVLMLTVYGISTASEMSTDLLDQMLKVTGEIKTYGCEIIKPVKTTVKPPEVVEELNNLKAQQARLYVINGNMGKVEYKPEDLDKADSLGRILIPAKLKAIRNEMIILEHPLTEEYINQRTLSMYPDVKEEHSDWTPVEIKQYILEFLINEHCASLTN